VSTSSNTNSWAIWIVAAIFYLYELVLRVAPSVMTDRLMESFGATSTVLGVLVSFYYYSYTILQLPCGVIVDKLGPRNLIGLSALLCVAGTAMFASAEAVHVAQIGRFMVGAGSACAFVSCLQIAASLFHKKYFVILVGITNMMGTMGGLLGGYPIARLVNGIGWRNTMYWLAALGIIIIALVFIVIPGNARDDIPSDSDKKPSSSIADIISLLKNWQVVLPSIISGFMYLTISVFAELWVVSFFIAKYDIGNELASSAAASVFIGIAVGSLVLAAYARRIKSYVSTIRMSAGLTALLFLMLIYIPFGFYMSLAVVFAIGFLTGAQAINFTCAKNSASPETAGTTVAFSNCIVMLIGAIFQPTLGVILDYFWNNTVGDDGIRIYDAACYSCAMLVIPVFLIIAYSLSFYLKETIHMEHEQS
jgi:predicted MFS family arabinose efflux permease